MSMNNREISTDDIRYQIELGKALDRLEVNSDFKLLIEDGYIAETLLTTSMDLIDTDPIIRQETEDKIKGVNRLKAHLQTVRLNAECAQQDLVMEA